MPCLAAVSRSYSLVAMHRLIVVTPIVEAHRLWDTWALVVVSYGLQSTESEVMAHRFSCPEAYGIFLDQGSNPCP